MNILVVVGHPSTYSFNRAIADTAVRTLAQMGHTVLFHDLHEEVFDPILVTEEIARNTLLEETVARHCAELSMADGIVIVHPNWWGQPPAILKGWIDRVFRPGVAYGFQEDDCGEGVPIGLLKAKAAVVFNTANTPERREREVFGDPLETIWKNCIFGLCGVETFYRRTFGVICTSSLDERRAWLDEVEEVMRTYFPTASKGERA